LKDAFSQLSRNNHKERMTIMRENPRVLAETAL